MEEENSNGDIEHIRKRMRDQLVSRAYLLINYSFNFFSYFMFGYPLCNSPLDHWMEPEFISVLFLKGINKLILKQHRHHCTGSGNHKKRFELSSRASVFYCRCENGSKDDPSVWTNTNRSFTGISTDEDWRFTCSKDKVCWKSCFGLRKDRIWFKQSGSPAANKTTRQLFQIISQLRKTSSNDCWSFMKLTAARLPAEAKRR